MIDRALFLGYRVVIVRVGLVLSWIALAGFAWMANHGPGPVAPDSAGEMMALAIMLLLLTLAPWRRALLGEFGDAYIGIWAAMATGGLIAAHDLHGGRPVAVSFIVVIAFCAAVLVRTGYLVVVTAAALAAYALTIDRAGLTLGDATTRVEFAVFSLAALLAVAASFGVSRVTFSAGRRLSGLVGQSEELEQRRKELNDLYGVSVTIGLGGTLAEIVPALMSRIVESVDSRVGLVFMFRPDHDDLELISPLWVSGRTVRAEGYRLALTDGGVVQRVFTSGEPLVSNEPDADFDDEPLLSDLDTSRLAAVSMAVEGKPIGVLVVADKSSGDFTEADMVRLQSLAGPAGLVMNQMVKYDAAQEMGQKMAELAQLKSDFVSVVSHELRSPLTSIIGSLRTILRPDFDRGSDTASEFVTNAARQADRLRSLIEDLLVASRLDSDALPVRPEETDIQGVFEELVDELPTAADRVKISIDEEVPHVEVDPAHLRRLLRNLLENALRYSEESPIEMTAETSGRQVWLSVIDHGPGIPYELHDHIFQRFTQAQHHETRMQGGTGLGLSIVRGLTEAMGGRVWFEPSVGGGATFRVALPMATAARQSDA